MFYGTGPWERLSRGLTATFLIQPCGETAEVGREDRTGAGEEVWGAELSRTRLLEAQGLIAPSPGMVLMGPTWRPGLRELNPDPSPRAQRSFPLH